MKKTLRYYLVALLAVVATVFSALGLVACDQIANNKKITELVIENAKVSFKVGDEFEYGEGFTVYALYADETKEDVTAKAEITKEYGFDMQVAGNYQITVSYGGKKEIYTVYVSEFDNILRKLELDTESVNKSYMLGDEISYEGLKVTLTYENAQGILIYETTSNLRQFNIKLTQENGEVSDDLFTALGKYTVTVSLGTVKDSYEVTVDGVNVSTVQGAIAVSKVFKTNVKSGTQHVKGSIKGAAYYNDYHYEYEFGDNYTYVKESVNSPVDEWYCSMYGDEIFVIQKQDNNMVSSGAIQNAMMEGARTALWYSNDIEYGIENTLANLYKHAQVCTNGDLKETVDEAKREYSFSFSGLELRGNVWDFYEQTVTFKLGEKLNVEHAEFTQKYYEYKEGESRFSTDVNGKTTATGIYSHALNVVVDQVAGERTAVNPYPKDSFKIQSFDLMYKGESLGDNGTINCSVSDQQLKLTIENIFPETASFEQFPLYFNYEGNYQAFQDSNGGILSKANQFNVARMGKVITVTLYNGCEFTLIFRTADLQKTVKINVEGRAPASMTAQIRNDASGVFNNGNAKSLGIGGTVYFRGNVGQYESNIQTATVTSSNHMEATVVQTEINGVKCFKFTATKAGVYTVKVASVANYSASCNFTFTVNEAPDYASVLVGKYTCTDMVDDVYLLTFTPENEGNEVKGTVVITRTPATNPNKPVTQTMTYKVDFGANEIKLTNVSGTNQGVLLRVELDGTLVLNDKNYRDYTLTPVNE